MKGKSTETCQKCSSREVFNGLCEHSLFLLCVVQQRSPARDNSWLMGNVPHKSDAALSVFILLL